MNSPSPALQETIPLNPTHQESTMVNSPEITDPAQTKILESIEKLFTSMAHVTASVQATNIQVANLQAANAQLINTQAVDVQTTPIQEVNTPSKPSYIAKEPDSFSRNRKELEDFLMSCVLYMRHYPKHFNNDRAKIDFIITHCQKRVMQSL